MSHKINTFYSVFFIYFYNFFYPYSMNPKLLTEVIINKKVEIEFIDNTIKTPKKIIDLPQIGASEFIIELYELRDVIDKRIEQIMSTRDNNYK